MIIEIIFIILGFFLLVKGADLLVKAATSIAKKFGLSEILIGLTIVAIGTSLPEVFVTVTSSLSNHSDLIIGNAIGSCICNYFLVIGITSLIHPVKLEAKIIKVHIPIGILAMVLLAFFGYSKTIDRWQGVILLVATIVYILYTIYEEKHSSSNERVEKPKKKIKEKNISLGKIIVFLILGLIGLKYGADFVVDNAVLIAKRFDLSEKFIGMTIIAIGTALPEIVTGIISARGGNTDLLLGNITGSVILNLCLLIGLGAVIQPLSFSFEYYLSLLVLLIVTIFLEYISMVNEKKELNGKVGVCLILLYAIYLVSMI